MSWVSKAMALRAPSNRSVSVSATATGRLFALEKLFGSASTFALAAGTNANLQLDSGDGIRAVAALGAGVSQDAIVQVSDGGSRMVQYKITCTGAPVAPSVPAVTLAIGNGQISVAWVDGSNGGSTITAHNIYLDGVLIASPTGASPYVITGLTNGTSYSVQVSAVNAVGEGALSSAQSATPVAATMLPYTLLTSWDSVGSATADTGLQALAIDTSSRKVLGTGGLAVKGVGSGTMRVNGAYATTQDMATWNVIAMCVDCGSGLSNNLTDVRPTFSSTYAYRVDNANATRPYNYNLPFSPSSRGKRWLSFRVANFQNGAWGGASVQSLGTANKPTTVSVQSSQNGFPDVVLDAFIRVDDSHKPAIMFTFDDNNVSQFNNRSVFADRNMPFTIYIPPARVGTAGFMTLSQILALRDLGCGMCLDSETNDNPLTAPATLAQGIAKLNEVRDWVSANVATTGLEHFCYSYGQYGYISAPTTLTCTSDGASPSVLTVPATNGYSTIIPGMRVFRAGVDTGLHVAELLSQTTVRLTGQVTAGSASFTFSARVFGLTLTCNGTNDVTVSSASNLFIGMNCFSFGLPETTKITGISGTTVTLSNPAPTGTRLADFGYADGEYWPTKTIDGLIAAGYKTGRRIQSNPQAVFSGYGLDPRQTLEWQALAADNNVGNNATPTSSAFTQALLGQLRHNVLEKRDTMLYSHQIADVDVLAGAHWPVLLDEIATWVAAGECEVLSVPAAWNKAAARLPIA